MIDNEKDSVITKQNESVFEREFSGVIGYEPIKLELKRIIDIMNNPEKYKELGVSTPSGILIDGEPGLGKTLMAKCFINASGRKSYTCRKDKPNGDFVNELKRVYEEAKNNAPSIVFLDDMDKFANEDEKHKNAQEFITVQSCIDDMKDFEVFTIATTNDMKNIPESLLRVGRFDKCFTIKTPKDEEAERIIDYYLSKKKFVGNVDIKQICKILNGCSCAQLETVINEAGIYAGFENKKKIEMKDIIRAVMRIIYNAPEELTNEQKDHIKEIAYHEAGHAVVAEVLEPDSVNIISVKKYNGDVKGVTSYYQNRESFQHKKYLENRVISLLAGKCATEIVFGLTDVGVHSDVKKACKIVEDFIDDYCTYGFDTFSFQYYDEKSNDFFERRERSIYREIDRYYQMTRRILCENREFLDKLADELEKKETLIAEDVQRIKKSCKIVNFTF